MIFDAVQNEQSGVSKSHWLLLHVFGEEGRRIRRLAATAIGAKYYATEPPQERE